MRTRTRYRFQPLTLTPNPPPPPRSPATLHLPKVLAGVRSTIIPADPLLIFILLLQSCMPSAQNSVVILQLDDKPEAAGSMARTISALYTLSVLPMALLISFAIRASGVPVAWYG